MLKKFVAATALFSSFAAFAAVDANNATVADLDGLKGVGPALSQRILDARRQGAFKDWSDLMTRVKGLKAHSASRLSAEGLTVNGERYGAGVGEHASQSATAR